MPDQMLIRLLGRQPALLPAPNFFPLGVKLDLQPQLG